MKSSVLRSLMLFALFSVPVFGASDGTIDCQGRRSVSVFSRPGGMIDIKQLECNQSVSIIGTERGYVEIEIDKNMRGFIEARYVRMPGSDQTAPAAAATAAKEKPRDPFSEFFLDVSYKDYPRFEIFGGDSFVHASTDGNYVNFNGWNASFAGNINSIFGIKGDFSGFYKNYDDLLRVNVHSFMAGPQITGRFDAPLDVFGHALFGVVQSREKIRDGNDYINFDPENLFAMALGGGLDWKIGDNLAIRAPQIDYFPFYQGGNDYLESFWIKNLRISAGVVFRFGGK